MYRYPHGNERLEGEITNLKRQLEEFNESDNEGLVDATIQAEKQWKKDKRDDKENYRKKKVCTEQISEVKVNGFSCEQCGKTIKSRKNFNRHVKMHTSSYSSKICGKKFNRKDNLKVHEKRVHSKPLTEKTTWNCSHCNLVFPTYQYLVNHVSTLHPLQSSESGGRITPSSSRIPTKMLTRNEENEKPSTESRPCKVQTQADNQFKNEKLQGENESAINNAVQNEMIFPNVGERYDLLTFFAAVRTRIESFLINRAQRGGIKYYLSVQVEMYRDGGEGDNVSQPHFRGQTYILLNPETLNAHDLNESFQKMFQSFETYIRESSGWILRRVLRLKIHTIIYKPLRGSSFIDLPASPKYSSSILNIENKDDKCLVWCILASLKPVELNPELVKHYVPFEQTLNLRNLDFPLSISQIDKFEKQFDTISVNVFTYENKETVPLKITRYIQRLHHVNLLLLKSDSVSHYCLITNLNRFLSRTSKHKSQMFFCCYCLHGFVKEKLLNEHIHYCSVHGPQKVNLPDAKNALLEFSDFEKTQSVPFVIYCD